MKKLTTQSILKLSTNNYFKNFNTDLKETKTNGRTLGKRNGANKGFLMRVFVNAFAAC